MLDECPQRIDISKSDQDWDEVAPDLWFSPSHVLGKELTLTIKAAFSEPQPDGPPKVHLEFHEDPKRLGLSRESKLVLCELFGRKPAGCVGKKITIIAGPNWARQMVIKILPRASHPADEKPQLELDPPPPPPPAAPEKPKPKPRRKRRDELED